MQPHPSSCIPLFLQEAAAQETVALLGCSMCAAKAVLMHYRWNREKVASELQMRDGKGPS